MLTTFSCTVDNRQMGHVNLVGHLSKTPLNCLKIHEIGSVDTFASKQQNYDQIWHLWPPYQKLFVLSHFSWLSQSPSGTVQRTAAYAQGGYFKTWYGREVPQWWPMFLKFEIRLCPYFIPHYDLIDPPLSAEKNQFVSITFSSRDTWT